MVNLLYRTVYIYYFSLTNTRNHTHKHTNTPFGAFFGGGHDRRKNVDIDTPGGCRYFDSQFIFFQNFGTGILSANGWMSLKWNDPRYSWEPGTYFFVYFDKRLGTLETFFIKDGTCAPLASHQKR